MTNTSTLVTRLRKKSPKYNIITLFTLFIVCEDTQVAGRECMFVIPATQETEAGRL